MLGVIRSVLLGELDGISRTFGHETSMPQAAPSI
jgi:hypothetical protein